MRAVLGEHPVWRRLVSERVERDELAVAVVGEDVGALDGLALEVNRGQDDDFVAFGDEVVRLGAEVLAHELPP